MGSQDLALLNELKDTDQDHEWYPTTNQIINAFFMHVDQFEIASLLDVGAGNGKVLLEFQKLVKAKKEGNNHGYSTQLYAVEKARPLLDSLPLDISIMGTVFEETIFLDKKVDCIFSNPPYSQFTDWAVKLIREGNAKLIYMVMPQRWKESKPILSAIEARNATYKIVGEFDFLSAEDRKARAKVDLVCIELIKINEEFDRWTRKHGKQQVDPFELWVKTSFGLEDKPNNIDSEFAKNKASAEARSEKINHAIVEGDGLIETLHNLYQADLTLLLDNYRKVCSLDAALFKELDISVNSIIENIKIRVKGLKDAYWYELFDNYETLTKRLTEKSRSNFISTIRANTNIDFTPSNAYAITAWAIKHANQYFDNQMIQTFEEMLSHANVEGYKSNQRVFKQNEYRYGRFEETHVKLDFRIVLHRCGGLSTSYWQSDKTNGLEKSAATFLSDLLVVADNLGFQTMDSINNHEFTGSDLHEFVCKEPNAIGRAMNLFTVRAYKNGNMHLKLNKKFALALNVEVGRLKGWIHNAQHAADELGEDVQEVVKHFRKTFTLLPNAMDTLLIGKL